MASPPTTERGDWPAKWLAVVLPSQLCPCVLEGLSLGGALVQAHSGMNPRGPAWGRTSPLHGVTERPLSSPCWPWPPAPRQAAAVVWAPVTASGLEDNALQRLRLHEVPVSVNSPSIDGLLRKSTHGWPAPHSTALPLPRLPLSLCSPAGRRAICRPESAQDTTDTLEGPLPVFLVLGTGAQQRGQCAGLFPAIWGIRTSPWTWESSDRRRMLAHLGNTAAWHAGHSENGHISSSGSR
ncbi:uncharacterized protein LOC120614082 isoform X1 [Pteropus medius]|uniref:uncharacterized protein LOC120614082 isoform X1 n=1 Tax=Pteropus vampyrus TaxID=132908 RepID=UPI00196BAE83|nr:uncharacterized protein LOC120614082 isoform X1 [Pteropus giganteus]